MVASKGRKGPSGSGKAVLEYLRKTNRPYSANDVCMALQGELTKSVVQRALAELTEGQNIQEKKYGKQSIFVIRQDLLDEADPGEMKDLSKQSSVLAESNKQVLSRVRMAQKELNDLKGFVTLEDAASELEQLRNKNEEMETRVSQFQSGKRQVTKADIEKVRKAHAAMQKTMKSRKRLFNDIFDTVTEQMPGKKKDIMEDMGIETSL
ncbi:Tat binding protein 1-interacting [Piptocephalis cylindrospora]|uniref:Tat binding protein 1-interacting n=1 Tax=Piptocephalis cylindrospora TaxID=1907219 RepID=A0A4P9Y8T7_9FUNG|nr:Tat binding protein 1-interacting [Piptocephalis cylindrospora]|eukprot:RKP15224.1 Tat binding protein 1-interacting [Piptocephalis cylindrospora]